QKGAEKVDAGVEGVGDWGVRAVFGYGSPQLGPPNKWWEDTRHRYPEDMRRLRKQYFSSDDQLVTLALAGVPLPFDVAASSWKLPRDVGARSTVHVGVGPERRRAKAGRGGRAQVGHHLHPWLPAERHRVEDDRRDRRNALARRVRRDDDGPWPAADPEGSRSRNPAESQRRRRDLGAVGLL